MNNSWSRNVKHYLISINSRLHIWNCASEVIDVWRLVSVIINSCRAFRHFLVFQAFLNIDHHGVVIINFYFIFDVPLDHQRWCVTTLSTVTLKILFVRRLECLQRSQHTKQTEDETLTQQFQIATCQSFGCSADTGQDCLRRPILEKYFSTVNKSTLILYVIMTLAGRHCAHLTLSWFEIGALTTTSRLRGNNTWRRLDGTSCKDWRKDFKKRFQQFWLRFILQIIISSERLTSKEHLRVFALSLTVCLVSTVTSRFSSKRFQNQTFF